MQVESTPGVSAATFRAAFRFHAASVAVITAATDSGPVAMTVSSLISVSAAPPTVAFSLSAQSTSARGILAADTCVIHFVGAGNRELAALCATPGIDRFADPARWATLATGEPLFCEVPTWFRARITGRLASEGGIVVTALLIDGQTTGDDGGAAALAYCNREWHRIGPASRIDG